MRRVLLLVSTIAIVSCAISANHDGAGGSSSLTPPPDDGGFGVPLPDGGKSGGFDGDPSAGLDPTKDNDGDGYFFADDCNDRDPMVNPGAYDVPGDGVDNDCSGKIDDPEPDCDVASLAFNSTNPLDLAKALGLCRFTTEGATGKKRTWGVLSAKLTRADGAGTPNPLQHGILKNFGTSVTPRQGKNLVALSSGTARTPDLAGFVTPISPSYQGFNEVSPPSGWPKNSPGCPTPTDNTANDSVSLELSIRVPTNASSLQFDLDFYSSEYIQFVCSPYNDTFVTLLDTKATLDPSLGGNISVDAKGGPINVNSGFFEVCTPGSAAGRTFACAKGTTELQGNGFWVPTSPKENGATSWLRTKAPVVPGETIRVRFMIWDTGDHVLDSTVLLDDFRWTTEATAKPITDRPK